ncbi:MAG TPA: family 20 glycosylhydrolase [Rhizomicrobium sp.]|nr:family 20 glycosylhydrolase [Rhizomicrobium sp.]
MRLSASILGALVLALSVAAPARAVPVVPLPATVVPGEGAVAIRNGAVVSSSDAAVGAYFRDLVRRLAKLKLRSGAHGGIDFRRDASVAGAEAYVLDATRKGVVVRAGTREGLFYGAVTLAQLLSAGGPLAAVHIEDAPRFAWRGLMLDSARHFQSVATVKKLIDAMALHKLNVLQWHLTDDQGWRIEIKKYPRLTQIGAWRLDADGRRTGGFYTQAQIRDVVAYAKARAITVVPEIEMPGHAMAAIVAYPKLGSAEGAPSRVTVDWGILPYLYNTDDSTFAFLEDVLSEVMALFPGPYIHVGGDEAVKDQWKANPAIQARMHALGLKDENALQSWFVSRIGAFLAAHGRRMIGWDEILDGGIPNDAAIMSWRGTAGAIAAAKSGHDTVLSPAPVLYFDNRQGTATSEPPGRGTVVTLKDVYAFDPAPAELSPDERRHVMGLQANIWTEHIPTDAQVSVMAFPRAAAVAELGWSGAQVWDGFARRMAVMLERYRALGIGYSPSAFAVNADARLDPARTTATVALASQAGIGEIHLTLDGTAPTANAPSYGGPFQVKLPAMLKAAAFLDGRALTAPTTRKLDAPSLLRRDSRELKLCGNAIPLSLAGYGTTFLVDIVNPCWIYEKAHLDGLAHLEAGVAHLPYNFSIGTDRDKIALHPPRTKDGELEVHLDDCAGAPIAVLPLSAAAKGVTTIAAALPPLSGQHDLCFVFTQRSIDPLWVLNWVQLAP